MDVNDDDASITVNVVHTENGADDDGTDNADDDMADMHMHAGGHVEAPLSPGIILPGAGLHVGNSDDAWLNAYERVLSYPIDVYDPNIIFEQLEQEEAAANGGVPGHIRNPRRLFELLLDLDRPELTARMTDYLLEEGTRDRLASSLRPAYARARTRQALATLTRCRAAIPRADALGRGVGADALNTLMDMLVRPNAAVQAALPPPAGRVARRRDREDSVAMRRSFRLMGLFSETSRPTIRLLSERARLIGTGDLDGRVREVAHERPSLTPPRPMRRISRLAYAVAAAECSHKAVAVS